MGHGQMMAVLDVTLREEKARARDLSQPGTMAYIRRVRREFKKIDPVSTAVVVVKAGGKMAKNEERYTAEVSFKITGIPAKDMDEALEKFRKYLGNNLRDSDSGLRKRFLKTAVVQKES